MDQQSHQPDFFRFRKNLSKDFARLQKHKVAILSDAATQLMHQAIRGCGYEAGLDLQIYEGGYDMIEQEVMTPSGLYDFKPAFVLFIETTRKLRTRFYKTPHQARSEFAANHIKHLASMLDHLKEHGISRVIYSNFVEMDDRVFGNYGNKIETSFIYQLRKLNYELMALAAGRKDLFINDVATLSARQGLVAARDLKQEVNAEMPFSLPFSAVFAQNTVGIILSMTGRMKKCLIMDLDNTLWGGIVGDDGMENLQLNELGIGKAFTSLQRWIKELKERGIILCVCSQNDENVAREVFKNHPDMILRLDDIAVFVANWGSKADNIRYIQSVLDIGFDSMVFIDDNPFERGLVRQQIPDVVVPELPEDPVEYLEYLINLNLFETSSFSAEDTLRTKQYQAEAQRVVLRSSAGSETDFLRSLEMRAEVKPFDKFSTPRIAQLIQRSNQFNLRTIRYSEADIASIADSPDYATLSFTLKDKFGDHGLIAAIILKDNGHGLFIDTWVMSCRVLKRGMEQFIMNEILEIARSRRIKNIEGEYIPTPKNGIVKDLFRILNFTPNNADASKWTLNVGDTSLYQTYINGHKQTAA